jgi:two-component system NarL family response regulator
MADGDPGNAARKTGKIRVLVADDHAIIRLGLRGLIDAQPDMQVVAEAADGVEAVRLFEEHLPDVTLMDLRMPALEGPEATAAILRRHPQANVVILTTYDGDEDVYRAVQAGARGYLLKDTFTEETLATIRSVRGGQRQFPHMVAEVLSARSSATALNAHERSILALVAKGLTNREIQSVLSIREGTLKNHLKRIFEKMEVTDRTEAAMVAVQQGIIRLPR